MEENQVIEQQEVVEQPVVEAPKEDSASRNLALMRKKLEAEEAARKEAERRAAEAERIAEERFAQRNASQSTSQVVDDEDPIDPDDYLQGKTFKKATTKLKAKQLEQEKELQNMRDKLAYMEAKSEISTIKDFYDVVTDDNLKTFARLYPDDYETAMANPNVTRKSKTIYNMIKNYGIADPMAQKNEARIQQNRQKPGTAAVASAQQPNTPLARLNDYERRVLTDEDRDRILAEVRRKKMSW